MPVELVVFDLGGVMVRICRTWQQALRQIGVNPSRLLSTSGSLAADVAAALAEANFAHETGRIDNDAFALQIAAATGLTTVEVTAALAGWLLGPYPGIDAVVDRLERASVRTACLSNTNAMHWAAFHSNGPMRLPLDRLHHRIASHEVGAMKPAPDIYAAVESQADITGERVLFFDDSLENITAAQSHGWQARQIDHAGDPMQQVHDVLSELGLPQ